MERGGGDKALERGEAVIDASVVVKWFVREEYTEDSLRLRDAYVDGLVDLLAPCILHMEVLNALKYSGGFGEDELKEVASILDGYQFTLRDLTGSYAERTVEIAMRKGLTIYDASYVALALVNETVLYTADEKLIRRVSSLGVVRHVAEFAP